MPSKVLGIASRGLDNLLLADLTAVLRASKAMYDNIDIPHASDTTFMSSLDTSRTYCRHDEMHQLLLTQALTCTRSALSPDTRLTPIIA